MSFIVVMGVTDGGLLLTRRQGRGRVTALSFLMLVLVSSVALVGNSQKEGEADMSASADGMHNEASLLSRLQSYPGIAARIGSFQRLGTIEQPAAQPELPSLTAGWEAEGAGRSAASAKLQYMQMQENAAKTAAAVGLMEHVLGISNPTLLAGMVCLFAYACESETNRETNRENNREAVRESDRWRAI